MLAAIAVSFVLAAQPTSLDTVLEHTFAFDGKERTYYVLVPRQARPDAPAPLLVLLHGWVDGRAFIESWQSLGKKPGHRGNYAQVNGRLWEFLRTQRLDAEPHFQTYPSKPDPKKHLQSEP